MRQIKKQRLIENKMTNKLLKTNPIKRVLCVLMVLFSFTAVAGDWFEVRLMTASKKSSISKLIDQLKLPQDQVRIHESTSGEKVIYILTSEPFHSKEQAQQAMSQRNYPKDAYVAKAINDGNHSPIGSQSEGKNNSQDATYFRLMQVLGGVNMAYTAQQQKLADMKKRAEAGEEKTLPLETINCLSRVMTRNGFANEFLPLYKNYFTPAQAGEMIFFAGIKEDPESSDVLQNLKARIDGYLTPTVQAELQQRMGFLGTRFVKRVITFCHIQTQKLKENKN
jgi:hypothetical protein